LSNAADSVTSGASLPAGGVNVGADSRESTPWKLNLIVVALLASLASGCAALSSPTPAYQVADKATFDAVAPEYLDYVTGDSKLSPEQIQRRQRMVETWRMRIEAK
jgi:hypothetical protein